MTYKDVRVKQREVLVHGGKRGGKSVGDVCTDGDERSLRGLRHLGKRRCAKVNKGCKKGLVKYFLRNNVP